MFRVYKYGNYKTYDVVVPCIASALWGEGLQAFLPSICAWFVYFIPPNFKKKHGKNPKIFEFTPKAGTGKEKLRESGS